MGSGLILLVIVGAWLAVLVPMGLRSHDSATTARSAERFETAMRVLARRTRLAPAGPSLPLRTFFAHGSQAVPSGAAEPAGAAAAAGAPAGSEPARPAGPAVRTAVRAAVTPQTRRRRTLLALLGLTAVSLVVGLVAVPLLVLAGGVLALVSVLFVLHCRRQAVLRADAVRRRAARRAAAEAPAAPPVRVPPRRSVPLQRPVAPTIARDVQSFDPLVPDLAGPEVLEDQTVRQPARVAGLGAEWQPVPVPLPTYVGKALAPVRRTQVLDLDDQGEWTPAVETEPVAPEEHDVVLDRRRAVGDW